MEDKNFTILCVDDEKSILNALKRLLRKEGYQLLFANSGKEGLETLAAHEVHLVISDQRMPEMSGTEFLEIVKEKYPDVLRIILTGYSDIDSITDSINKGNIYKFFFKPWNDIRLKSEIRQITEQIHLIQANKRLDETVVQQNKELHEMNTKVENLVRKRTQGIELENHILQFSHAILEDLPISVIGIDHDGVIVVTNKMAEAIVCKQGAKRGRLLRDCFPEEVVDIVKQVLETGQRLDIDLDFFKDRGCQAKLLPLTGSYEGKGVILTMDEPKASV
jgi:response regulator RpfG family c-di-GMP phosphodiesterase